MADVRDILELERISTPEITIDSIINNDKKIKKYPQPKAVKRPEGMHREVFALLYNDNKDAPPLLPTETGCGYKQTKARLGMRKTRPWRWIPFTNPARTDGAVFHHWRRVTDEPKEYPFAKFNKQLNIPSYTDEEFQTHLKGNSNWEKPQTDHLFDLAKRFDLRFVIMADRWDKEAHGSKTVEDLKERYYEVCGILTKLKGEKKVYVYDADHERKRKEQLRRLFDRTEEQIKEEETLMNEMKKIEVRKKERDRKTQDLQKLISQADQQSENAVNNNASSSSNRKQDRKITKKRVQPPSRPSRTDPTVLESAGIKFPDLRGSGVSLRSHRMKLPASVGQKKSKAIEGLLQEYNVENAPMPTEEICTHFNELRSDMVLLCELRSAFANCEFELQALRHQYEVLCPGMTLSIPDILVPNEAENKNQLNNAAIKTSNLQPVSSAETVETQNTTTAH
ncbi:DNA methyltransferase 1-associated protein 1-like [Ctenocephalides felis]|uniref:DNA methyltransferase 1-associated protein 1-like n=1 Tax=Ctenocephalides felis TaxID=7515 RepID=UPI000E6E58CD|nr:DNA methyltransferase 1-associated protein 1-like [Ctenocephalides felis]